MFQIVGRSQVQTSELQDLPFRTNYYCRATFLWILISFEHTVVKKNWGKKYHVDQVFSTSWRCFNKCGEKASLRPHVDEVVRNGDVARCARIRTILNLVASLLYCAGLQFRGWQAFSTDQLCESSGNLISAKACTSLLSDNQKIFEVNLAVPVRLARPEATWTKKKQAYWELPSDYAVRMACIDKFIHPRSRLSVILICAALTESNSREWSNLGPAVETVSTKLWPT